MRALLTVCSITLMSCSLAGAQTTPAGNANPNETVAAAKLDAYLLRWEQEMKKVQTLAAVIAREDKDKSFGTVTKYQGQAQYMKTGTGATALNLAAMELKQANKAEISDKFICTGTYLYQFLPAQKEIRAYEMPKPKAGQVGEDSFLGFLFTVRAEEAQRRYILRLYKEDTYYIYVDVAPRFPADRADFTRARLVLNKDSYLPRQLWFEHPNGNEITWDIPRLQAGVTLDRRSFDAPRVPPGWKLVPVSRTATAAPVATPASLGSPPPRVVRPSK